MIMVTMIIKVEYCSNKNAILLCLVPSDGKESH